MSEVNINRRYWKLAKSWGEDFHPGNLLCWADGRVRPQAVIRGSVTICEFVCLAIRYALVPLPARSGLLSHP